MILGERDTLVDNNAARHWHNKTLSDEKEIKLMAGSFHELSKEPNNSVLFETIFKFISRQKNKEFGTLMPTEIRFAS
jgi:esterase/lipase